MKDLPQKKLAVRFCAAQEIVPFMEVLVHSETGLEEVSVDITDIDVLGHDFGNSGPPTRTLFDCKSGTKQMSPINRALWASGLCKFVQANSAYIIQQKEAVYSHKLAANTMGVHIHSENSFIKYAESTSGLFAQGSTYLDDLGAWDSLSKIGSVIPCKDIIYYLSNYAAMENSGPKSLRHGLSALLKASPELNPNKPNHKLLFGVFLSSFLISLSITINGMKDVFDFSMSKETFERTLRFYVWDGKENYNLRKSMRSAIQRSRGDAEDVQLELPEWEKFLHLVRSMLDAPEALKSLSFLAKELAFRSASQKSNAPADIRIIDLFLKNNRARQFLFATSEYLVRAGKLPGDFHQNIVSEINELIAINKAPANTVGDLLKIRS